MSVSFASYEIARSGLMVNERGLYVTGHNISNVNTPGYVRQQAMIKNGPVETVLTRAGLVQLGLGADIQEIRQIRHTFLDNIYRQENTTLGYWEARQKTYIDLQAIMAEPMESGLQNVLNQFWDSWQELSKEPDSLTVRALVRQRSEALIQQINHMGSQLDRLQNDLNTEIIVRVDEVNEITREIAKLNVAILKSEVSGDTASDYRDQRNTLIDRLTKLIKVDVNEMQDGQIDITLGGYFIVQKGVSTDLYTAERKSGDNFIVVKLGGTNIEVPIKSGIIKGLMESRGEVSGAIGSHENGTPNTRADVVFYADTSTMSHDDVVDRANAYRAELERRGLDCTVTVIDAASAEDFASVVGTATLRSNANKYAFFVTNDSLTAAQLNDLQTELTGMGMDASVITDTPSDWSALTDALDGAVYDIDDFSLDLADDSFASLISGMSSDTNMDVSTNFSLVGDSLNIVSEMKKRLNALVNVMLREINYIHSSGMNMKDPPEAGEELFVTINPGRLLEMGNIRLNPNLADLSNIAASRTGAAGDNTIALEIANLRNKDLIVDSTGIVSLDDYYQDIILHMGNNGSDAARIAESQSKLVESADAQRTAVTGVSMDEEMTNMMKYKFAYDAASRVLNIIDTMMETIVNRLGTVGR
ncbi:MAG: flagellar hook-associated protein FlgK [Clostridiaceae bacterium]|nr:flagellar hook-associated protein FlgK [Clostridiaceae bacterium]